GVAVEEVGGGLGALQQLAVVDLPLHPTTDDAAGAPLSRLLCHGLAYSNPLPFARDLWRDETRPARRGRGRPGGGDPTAAADRRPAADPLVAAGIRLHLYGGGRRDRGGPRALARA